MSGPSSPSGCLRPQTAPATSWPPPVAFFALARRRTKGGGARQAMERVAQMLDTPEMPFAVAPGPFWTSSTANDPSVLVHVSARPLRVPTPSNGQRRRTMGHNPPRVPRRGPLRSMWEGLAICST
ncbi:uncharacterized protein TRAVEDRAFT_54825 [Trametes versicolor FP-101664 SS1]|uniref:Uncharacterized protein n=1 Tax=Trametes versicolor (strain FP-101664) TaxID=717944 RepID=R7S607_TRAVS|nr:uncharacterized protein TRAVEDRAFT_54825 [Trametes versicolor FP-101664 SS1]EIW51168.1 hypothetical protein TRAVEDRAFT_54825 [Trametes versicolor FP-101664 SS1]